MSLEQNKAIARSIFEVGLNEKNPDAIAALTAPDFIDHDIHVQTGVASGPEDMRVAIQNILVGFPDMHVTVEQVIAEGEDVVTRNTWRGTHLGEFNGIPATGKRVEFQGIVIWRIVDGLVKERRATIDLYTALQQLGVLAPA
jgi:steroid delta-isomerase-like uncharacterized protein